MILYIVEKGAKKSKRAIEAETKGNGFVLSAAQIEYIIESAQRGHVIIIEPIKDKKNG